MFCLRCKSHDLDPGYEKAEFGELLISYTKCLDCGLVFGIQMDGPDAHRFRKTPIGRILFWDVPGLTRIMWYEGNNPRRIKLIPS